MSIADSFVDRAKDVIAHGALTNSKRPESFIEGVYPTHLVKARGCYAWDVSGRRYIDYICSLGAILLGHANNSVIRAIRAQLDLGSIFSLSSALEIEYAERIRALFPYMEKIRILKTGTEGCMAAIRIARSFTGRPVILTQAYHGWSDDFVSLTPPASGVVLCDRMIATLNDLEQINQKVAAVIVEPVITQYDEHRITWLNVLREQCTRQGALLIFDEVITGGRFEKFSVANAIGIRPDISVKGKALGGGLPLAVVGGRREVMDSEYFVSSTFAGDTLAMAASLALIKELTPEIHSKILTAGDEFRTRFNKLSKLVQIDGYHTRGVFAGSEMHKALFMQEACKAGVLFGPSWFYSKSHIEENDNVLNLCGMILQRIESGQVKLEGKMPVKPYTKKVREI